MQTFLPYASFVDSARALDLERLGKQRVETFQLLRALTAPDHGWRHHPAAKTCRTSGRSDARAVPAAVAGCSGHRAGHTAWAKPASAAAMSVARWARCGGISRPFDTIDWAHRRPAR